MQVTVDDLEDAEAKIAQLTLADTVSVSVAASSIHTVRLLPDHETG